MYQADDGTYYLHDYIPTRLFADYDEESVEQSKKIWRFKDGDKEVESEYAWMLLKAIAELAPGIRANKIALVAVPPSKADKYSPMRSTIDKMVELSETGALQIFFGCDKKLISHRDLLLRDEDVATSHRGPRATYEDHLNTISCGRDHLSRLWSHFIILDDVSTTGDSMSACKQILIDHGVPERYITCLALAKTVWS